jgi:type IV pilus assembly protein PilB
MTRPEGLPLKIQPLCADKRGGERHLEDTKLQEIEPGNKALGEQPIERLLIEEHLVTRDQIDRAHRVIAHMQKPRPIGEVLVRLGILANAEYDRVVRLHRSKLGLVDILQETGSLDEAGIQAYREASKESPHRTERDILMGDGLVEEERLLQAISTKYDIPYVEPDVSLVDISLLSKVSIPYLLRHHILPFRMIDGSLNAMMADPLDRDIITELERTYGTPVKPCAAPSRKITEALETLEYLRESRDEEISTSLQYHEIRELPEGDEEGEGAIRIVDYLLTQAISLAASDIHVEPLETKVRVRVRIDGSIRHLTDLPGDFAARIGSRIKVLAGMDIAERRLHQDGRFFVKADGGEIDIRVSSYASMFGETIVLRLLDRHRGLIPLGALGFQPSVFKLLKDLVLRSSSGMVLLTGPTGSGKTTSMYSFVDYVNNDQLKVISCENPVEYVLEGTTQCSVNEKTGPTFADSLKAIVRQDPDIILVGEIRDSVSVRLAAEAALTGHKVFSTFHTEDSVAAVTRLLEMGIEPFLVSSTLSCIVAQRLVRRICENCRRPAKYTKEDLRYLGLTADDLHQMPVFEGAGCPECQQTGYRGRIGIYEVIVLDDDFRDATLSRPPSKVLRAVARNIQGFLTLQEDGLLKVFKGETTLSEVADKVPRDADNRNIEEIRRIAAIGK